MKNAASEFLALHPWRFGARLFQGLTLATLSIGAIGLAGKGIPERVDSGAPSGSAAKSEPAAFEGADGRPAEYYLRAIRGKNLFRTLREEVSVPAAAKPEVPAPPPVPVKTLAELAEDLTLVGVVQSDPPQAVIVHKKTRNTHYLSEGQSLGEIGIIGVREDRAVLGFNGETLELTM